MLILEKLTADSALINTTNAALQTQVKFKLTRRVDSYLDSYHDFGLVLDFECYLTALFPNQKMEL